MTLEQLLADHPDFQVELTWIWDDLGFDEEYSFTGLARDFLALDPCRHAVRELWSDCEIPAGESYRWEWTIAVDLENKKVVGHTQGFAD